MAAAVIAAAAATSVVATPTVSTPVAPAVFGVPLPQDPAADVPSADQLNSVLSGLANPSVPFANKAYLVEGGIGRLEARTADALMRNAVAKGQLPLSFSVGAITPAGPGAASATVTATGPGMPPTTQNVTFINQGSWKLSRASAATVLAIFGG
jgi:hypothetical protein